MRRRDRRIAQIRSVEREHQVIAVAVGILADQLRSDPSGLAKYGLGRVDFDQSADNIDATYLIRLFAEFETGLREAWRFAWKRDTHPPTSQLLASIATRCSAPEDWFDAAEQVRVYRNALVHEADETSAAVPIAVACKSLCRFFSRLPPNWLLK
jgi:hypothetical protein